MTAWAVLPWIVNRWFGESGLVVEVAVGTLSWEAGVVASVDKVRRSLYYSSSTVLKSPSQ